MTKTSKITWYFPPPNLTLPSDEVHIWHTSLDLPAERVLSLQQALTPDEVDRAAQFYFQRDRQHFIVARGLLRVILGGYLKLPPNQLRFHYGHHGKPALATTSGREMLKFNLSHAAGRALYAVTRGREVGVDLERIRDDLKYEQVASRFFSSQENAVLSGLPTNMKSKAFFNCWTRKEAYIKAKGEGLSMPLNQFDVTLVPGEPARLLNTRGEPQEASRWSLRELILEPGYVTALAVEGHGWKLACWQWPC